MGTYVLVVLFGSTFFAYVIYNVWSIWASVLTTSGRRLYTAVAKRNNRRAVDEVAILEGEGAVLEDSGAILEDEDAILEDEGATSKGKRREKTANKIAIFLLLISGPVYTASLWPLLSRDLPCNAENQSNMTQNKTALVLWYIIL